MHVVPLGGEMHSQGFLQQSKTKIRLTQLSLQLQDKPRVTNSDKGLSFSKVHTLPGNHWSKCWLQYWDFFYTCSIRSFLKGKVLSARLYHTERLLIDEAFAVFFHVHRSIWLWRQPALIVRLQLVRCKGQTDQQHEAGLHCLSTARLWVVVKHHKSVMK